jgi:hypothetical protein
LFEVKGGPFDPVLAKEIAPWAPNEEALNSLSYVKFLKDQMHAE